jgi:hypothetical protein
MIAGVRFSESGFSKGGGLYVKAFCLGRGIDQFAIAGMQGIKYYHGGAFDVVFIPPECIQRNFLRCLYGFIVVVEFEFNRLASFVCSSHVHVEYGCCFLSGKQLLEKGFCIVFGEQIEGGKEEDEAKSGKAGSVFTCHG